MIVRIGCERRERARRGYQTRRIGLVESSFARGGKVVDRREETRAGRQSSKWPIRSLHGARGQSC